MTLQLEVKRLWIQIPVRPSVRYEETGLTNPESIDTVVVEIPRVEKPITVNVQHVR